MSARRAAVARPADASDAEILHRLSMGELGALGELYDRHQAAIRRFIARATSDAEDVDDLTHATFLTAAKGAKSYDGRSSCRPWLIGIAVRLLRRRRTAFRRFLEVLSFVPQPPASIDPRGAMDARSDIARALAKISEPKRITLLMAEVEGLRCQEIAEILDVPIGTVWTRLHAARRELRTILERTDRSREGGSS